MSKGFTLIELMIVVAVIGLIAALAIPAYSSYTARAQISEAITLLSGMRSDINTFSAANGRLPNISELSSGVVLSGKYVDSITFATSPVDQYVATFATSGISPQLAGNSIYQRFDPATGQFSCGSNDIDAVLISRVC